MYTFQPFQLLRGSMCNTSILIFSISPDMGFVLICHCLCTGVMRSCTYHSWDFRSGFGHYAGNSIVHIKFCVDQISQQFNSVPSPSTGWMIMKCSLDASNVTRKRSPHLCTSRCVSARFALISALLTERWNCWKTLRSSANIYSLPPYMCAGNITSATKSIPQCWS